MQGASERLRMRRKGFDMDPEALAAALVQATEPLSEVAMYLQQFCLGVAKAEAVATSRGDSLDDLFALDRAKFATSFEQVALRLAEGRQDDEHDQ